MAGQQPVASPTHEEWLSRVRNKKEATTTLHASLFTALPSVIRSVAQALRQLPLFPSTSTRGGLREAISRAAVEEAREEQQTEQQTELDAVEEARKHRADAHARKTAAAEAQVRVLCL